MSSPSPKPASRWGRLGTAVRRSSTLLAISRPTTPSIDQDSDTASLSKAAGTTRAPTPPNAPPAIPPAPAVSAPSPIAESPAREAAALEESILGPSPLTRQVTEPVTEPATEQDKTEQDKPAQTAEEVISSPSEYVPPPVIDSSAGNPGAFTDDPEELPAAEIVSDPYAPSTRAASVLEVPPQERVEAAVEPSQSAPVEVEAPPQEQETVKAEVESPVDITVESPVQEDEPMKAAVEPPHTEESISHFDKPAVEDFEPVEEGTPAPTNVAREVDPAGPSGPVIIPSHVEQADIPDMEHGEAAEYYRGGFEAPAGPSIHEQQEAAVPKWDERRHEPDHSYSLPSYSGQEVWGGIPVADEQKAYHDIVPVPLPMPGQQGNRSIHESRAASVRNGHATDPFADPAPQITYSNSDALHMPQPELAAQRSPLTHEEDHESIHGAIIMPLPARGEVMHAQNFDRIPSQSTYNPARVPYETDETVPLLPHPASKASYLASGAQSRVFVSPMEPSTSNNSNWQQNSTHSPNQPRLHDLGWLEYHLPDGTIYYVHPTRRVTTDCNLRADRVLSAVSAYLDDNKDGSSGPAGSEMWLRDVGTQKKGFVPERCWVDHNARAVVTDQTGKRTAKGKKVVEEDQLDVEYRYWSYIEAHPAHTPLPSKAKAEAMDVLNWAWTDRLLPSVHAIPAPFTQAECQELSGLLRSFGPDEHQNENGIQSRIVSRILLRVAQWRQHYFRPTKPLPQDTSNGGPRLPTQRRPIRRAVFDFIISCLCLGIPYIFLERARNSRIDEESGLRNGSPMIVVGACTCLVAAIILSASVTFLSLPGLDSISRTAGIVAILFATFSMASTVVAIFRHKSDMERSVSHVGIQGLVMITRRTVVFSLPLVFLTYSIIGFLVGIILYSIRGASFVNPAVIRTPFEDYTRWSVIGVGGALAGMLATSLLLLRR